ncbi:MULTISPECIES: hypothetical protein [unclassified Streptomyces]|uniref:hypothetical protein n=1 Tax=unclassified Streptomyces TaxID=2593676 RepID=UPI001370D0C7|nr:MULTISPECIES: hypothetical protein [unclassified Streptomyces]MYY87394.1 hypothetical protein [Streptomyces sp. SID335]MYZ17872.1 hypothetical protein [Streptomyces sp. SID337]NDZ86132.1 hypothetical protein [Streptomyces sp. SID10115]NEB44933.1 hypothetical protein [Streptomyces sp. SID339]
MRRPSQWTRTAQHAWRHVAPTAALVSLVATLFMCLAPVAPDGAHEGTGHATVVTRTAPADCSASPRHRAAAVGSPDCPDDDQCCAPSAHGVRATPAPAGPTLADPHRQVPYPQALSAPGPAPEQPSNRGSPDLHMLQVQRT